MYHYKPSFSFKLGWSRIATPFRLRCLLVPCIGCSALLRHRLFYCQTTQARLAASKLPHRQPQIYLVHIAASISKSGITHKLASLSWVAKAGFLRRGITKSYCSFLNILYLLWHCYGNMIAMIAFTKVRLLYFIISIYRQALLFHLWQIYHFHYWF